MKERKAEHERISNETEIKAELNIDGAGNVKIQTQIGLLDHMLELFAFHGYFDLNLDVNKADLEIDIHHTNEDVGIVLGKIFKEALGEKQGIRRFGSAFAPMEKTLGHSVIDISGRGEHVLKLNDVGADTLPQISNEHDYKFKHFDHFLESFAKQLGANIIVNVKNPKDSTADLHTILETIFKSLGLALDQATQVDPRRKGAVPSTKGIID